MSQNVLDNILQVERLFMEIAYDVQEQTSSIESIIEGLESTPLFLRSFAYESASMAIAYLDFSSNPQGKQWEKFYSSSPSMHMWHIQIGLGLGYAKADMWPIGEMENSAMVFDGIGYYYALFSGRKTIKMQKVPSELSGDQQGWFDVGVGRRLWYTAKGNPVDLGQLVELFEETRRNKLWHGVGVACGYVGGVDSKTLKQLGAMATVHLQSFKLGFCLALTNRKGSKSHNIETEAAYSLAFGSTS